MATDGKTIAIISYLTWIGWIVALIMNSEKKDKFASFHIRQTLIIFLTAIVLGFFAIIPFLGWLVMFVGGIALFVFWVMGLIYAINGEQKLVPIIGEYGQEWFKGL